MKSEEDFRLAVKIGYASEPIFRRILDERHAQDKKWGEQNHPSVLVHPRGEAPRTPAARCASHGLPSADTAKRVVETMATAKQLTWTDIAVEELAEAVEAPNDKVRLEELVQLAAVVVAWIECIQRRING